MDVRNFNASRIWKCYGTIARKGDSTADRPHREASILDTPAPVLQVPPELLMRLSDTIPDPPKRNHRQSPSDFDLDEWVSKSGLAVAKEGAWNTTGYRWVLEACPFNADHTDQAAVIPAAPVWSSQLLVHAQLLYRQ